MTSPSPMGFQFAPGHSTVCMVVSSVRTLRFSLLLDAQFYGVVLNTAQTANKAGYD